MYPVHIASEKPHFTSGHVPAFVQWHAGHWKVLSLSVDVDVAFVQVICTRKQQKQQLQQ